MKMDLKQHPIEQFIREINPLKNLGARSHLSIEPESEGFSWPSQTADSQNQETGVEAHIAKPATSTALLHLSKKNFKNQG